MLCEITLPWPCRDCSPNSRGHWRKLHAARKRRKNDAFLLSCGMPKLPNTKHKLTIEFYPPNRRRYDLDNLLASLKGDLDGLCARLGIDDHNLNPITISLCEPTQGGSVRIMIG
jgi:crossover junction endodeoxyribonuclease RusA